MLVLVWDEKGKTGGAIGDFLNRMIWHMCCRYEGQFLSEKTVDLAFGTPEHPTTATTPRSRRTKFQKLQLFESLAMDFESDLDRLKRWQLQNRRSDTIHK